MLIPSNALFIPVDIFPNMLVSLTTFAKLEAKLPIPEVTDNSTDPKLPNTLPNGVNAFATLTIVSLTTLNTSNIPLNVVLIFLAVSSFILILYVRSLNLVESSTNF